MSCDNLVANLSRFGAPGIRNMGGQSSRRNEHEIEADVKAGMAGMSGEIRFGGTFDSPALARAGGFSGRGEVGARLYLDECQERAPSRNEIDFADGSTITLLQDSVTL